MKETTQLLESKTINASSRTFHRQELLDVRKSVLGFSRT